jgi:DNA-binding transcriptional MocR family regulator
VNDKPFAVRDQRTVKRFWIDDAVYDTYAAQIGVYAYAVYTALVRHADTAQTCFPSYATIAKKLGISKRHVIRQIEKLVEIGLIKASPRQKTGKRGTDSQDSNLYTLLEVGLTNKGVVTNSHYPSDCQSPPLVTNSHPKEAHIKETQSTATKPQNQNIVAAADFDLSIWNELKAHGITRNRKTTAIVQKLAATPHAVDIIKAEAKKIANDKKNKAGVLVDLLANFDIATYTPPVKQIIKVISEY